MSDAAAAASSSSPALDLDAALGGDAMFADLDAAPVTTTTTTTGASATASSFDASTAGDLNFSDSAAAATITTTATTFTNRQQSLITAAFSAVPPDSSNEIPSSSVLTILADLLLPPVNRHHHHLLPPLVCATVGALTEGLATLDFVETLSVIRAALSKTPHWGRLATPLTGPLGLAELDGQVLRRQRRRGYVLNLLVAGASGLGKSSFIDTLFRAGVSRRQSCKKEAEAAGAGEEEEEEEDRKNSVGGGVGGARPGGGAALAESLTTTKTTTTTTSIFSVTHVLSEAQTQLKLTITDTPGFGDSIDNTDSAAPILAHIDAQYSAYLDAELAVRRPTHIMDTRVHAVLYFVAPTGHGLCAMDIAVLRALGERANVVVLLAKSDSMTAEERENMKTRVRQDLHAAGIRVYAGVQSLGSGGDSATADAPPPSVWTGLTGEGVAADAIADPEGEEASFNARLQAAYPFAVVAANHEEPRGAGVARGRMTRAGFVDLEDEKHCDFALLRDMLLARNLVDLVESTASVHYEAYRARNLEQGE